METTDTENMTAGRKESSIEEQLSQVFGSYRAEGLKERIFDLFNEPDYFVKLIGPHACILMGGRGTGKTTVLRLLGYEGQFARSGRLVEAIQEWSYIGLYHRINLNRVNNFKGPELTNERWEKVFAHYLNLVLCNLILDFLGWYTEKTGEPTDFAPAAYRRITFSLHLDPCSSRVELTQRLDEVRIRF